MDLLPVVALVGRLVVGFAHFMAVPLAFTLARHDAAEDAFVLATGITFACGLALSLLTRRFMIFVGGLGIIVLAVAILPLLGVGGTQLYKAEMAGPMKD